MKKREAERRSALWGTEPKRSWGLEGWLEMCCVGGRLAQTNEVVYLDSTQTLKESEEDALMGVRVDLEKAEVITERRVGSVRVYMSTIQ